MNDVDTIATMFQDRRLAEMEPLFRDMLAKEQRSAHEQVYEIYLNLYARGNHELALNFILSYCNSFEISNQLILYFGSKIFKEQDIDVGINLLMIYIQGKGENISAFEMFISYCMIKSRHDVNISVYEQYIGSDIREKLSATAIFHIGTSYMQLGNFDKALGMFLIALDRKPNFPQATRNVRHLAMVELFPPAIDYVERQAGAIAAAALPGWKPPQGLVSHVVHWSGDQSREILESISQHGFCYIKNGCDQSVAGEVLAHLSDLHDSGTIFPIGFTTDIETKIKNLFRFDAAQIMQDMTGRVFQVDQELCVCRRVNPEHRDSFVPFHQDSTAFYKPLFNIWTPVTPAGRSYPSIQFVKKLITTAEQTKIFSGEYNLIEIDSDYVLEKYGDLIFEANDAEPGDCVLFYGTTIHRSSNLSRATLPRYNIEVRWSAA